MLGVCYYPEHWPEEMWADDAREMVELGLEYVRIAEFAWSRLEAGDGHLSFDWLDRAIETLGRSGLKVILGTPTATPPKWLVDKYPDVMAVDIHTGVQRGFGSRRHYDFSSENYLRESLRITELMAKRYSDNPYVVGWQTDNEIACHDTAPSASESAKVEFQRWCKNRYGNIEALNSAWGNVFWSMEYQGFDQIELPLFAVTETNPSHQLAFRRFCSDQIVHFHNEMVTCIREHTQGQFVTHNFIPMSDTQTDNYALAEPLDFASYDNYPLGRTDLFWEGEGAELFKPYMRTGHPDFSSYYFDQVRGLSKGNFWIMEQQPGPVNWAEHNPRPLGGMVRLWSWQALAHGAETVCYFRWRQAPFAQEQMHAGIKRSDNSKAIAWNEVSQFRDELKALEFKQSPAGEKAEVAILSATQNQWVCEIEQQSASFRHEKVEFSYYSALRQLGIDVDFISERSDISAYKLIVAPCQPIVSDAFIERCQNSDVAVVFGPRSGSKTDEFQLPENLAPGKLQQLLPVKVLSSETTRPDCFDHFSYNGRSFKSFTWNDELAVGDDVEVIAQIENGYPAVVKLGRIYYLATITCDEFLKTFFADLASEHGVTVRELAPHVRVSKRGNFLFYVNFGGQRAQVTAPTSAQWVLGSSELDAHSVAIAKLG